MNYSELFETIKGYCENDFPDVSFLNSTGDSNSLTSTEQLNIFIKQAEQKVYNSVQILDLLVINTCQFLPIGLLIFL